MNEPVTPIYLRLFERYRDDILSFKLQPGQRVDSIAEIQAKYRVGRETAKRALGLLAKEGYILQRRGRGSFVADRRPRQKSWGMVLPFYSIQFEELIAEISQRARNLDREFHHFCDYNNFEEEMRLVGTLLRERYEAVLVIPTLDESITWNRFYSKLSSNESEVVLLDHTMTSNDFRYVIQSYDLGVTRGVSHLMEQGEGGIAFVENEHWAGRNMVSELMRGTYQELMRTRRPSLEPWIVSRAGSIREDEFHERGITGFFCCDDISAIQVIGHLREQGIEIPDEAGVVSYGNTALSRYFTPPITTVDPRHPKMADVLCDLLFPVKLSGGGARQHVVQPELLIRGT